MCHTQKKRREFQVRKPMQRDSALKGCGMSAELCGPFSWWALECWGWSSGVKFGPDVKNHISRAEVCRHYPVVRVGAKSLYGGE